MRLKGMIKTVYNDVQTFTTSTWFEFDVGGLLECIKLITPKIYENIINNNYDENDNLILEDCIEDFIAIDDNFKNEILEKIINKEQLFRMENSEYGLMSFNEPEYKLTNEQRVKNIGGFVICRLNTSVGMHLNCDNINAPFSINKIFLYHDKNISSADNDFIKRATTEIKKQLQDFLDSFINLNGEFEDKFKCY